MVRKSSFVFHASLVVALAFVMACGSEKSEDSSNNGTGTGTSTGTSTGFIGTGTGTSTGTGTGTVSSGGSCTTDTFAAGVKIVYGGAKGTAPFTDANKAYFGTIVNIFSNGKCQAQFNGFSSTQTCTVFLPHAVCTPDIVGKTVLYTGPTNTSFPSATATYTGTIKDVYAGSNQYGNAHVDWDHLADDTVESFQNIAIAVQ